MIAATDKCLLETDTYGLVNHIGSSMTVFIRYYHQRLRLYNPLLKFGVDSDLHRAIHLFIHFLTISIMKFEVTKVSDLLPLNATTQRPVAINSLSPAELEQYLKAANKFIDEWNAANPDGMKLRLPIVRLNVVPNGQRRVSIIVAENPNYNSPVFTYPVSVATAIANGLGLPSFASLQSTLSATGNTPSHVELVVRLVKQGEEYMRNDGMKATYKCPGVATIGREEIKLSDAAMKRIGSLTAKVDEIEMLAFRQHAGADAAPPIALAGGGHADDDDTIGG